MDKNNYKIFRIGIKSLSCKMFKYFYGIYYYYLLKLR